MGHWAMVAVILIVFVATLIRSVFGFGEALVAVPLLAFVMPVEVAAPLAVLVSITIAFLILLQDWRHVQMREAGWLVFSTLLGIPLGLLLLKVAPEAAVKMILGAIIIMFSAYTLTGRNSRLGSDRLSWLFGFTAGILGGAYGMNGPPLAIYGALRGWSPAHFRSTLQAYFLPASVAGMVGYGLAGLWTPAVNHDYFVSLPGVVLAIFLGRSLNRRMHAPQFISYVYIGLAVIGAVLVLQAIAGWTHVFR